MHFVEGGTHKSDGSPGPLQMPLHPARTAPALHSSQAYFTPDYSSADLACRRSVYIRANILMEAVVIPSHSQAAMIPSRY